MADYLISTNSKSRILKRDDDLGVSNIESLGSDHYHVIKDGVSYHCRLLSVSDDGKYIELALNGAIFKCQIADEMDLQIETFQLNANKRSLNKNLISTMPGLVLKILVKEGDMVTAGQPLIVLEAMKMENILSTISDGTILNIRLNEGDSVDKGQMLIEIE